MLCSFKDNILKEQKQKEVAAEKFRESKTNYSILCGGIRTMNNKLQ